MPSSVSNFDLPLSPELHERLREEAEVQQQQRHAELAAWAAQHAGSDLDLDGGLEQAGLEVLKAEPLH